MNAILGMNYFISFIYLLAFASTMFGLFNREYMLDTMAQTCNPTPWEVESGRIEV
jgi:hypothetical protein